MASAKLLALVKGSTTLKSKLNQYNSSPIITSPTPLHTDPWLTEASGHQGEIRDFTDYMRDRKYVKNKTGNSVT